MDVTQQGGPASAGAVPDGRASSGAHSGSGGHDSRRRRLLVVVLVIAGVAAGSGARLWWRHHHYVETDNAYVTGRIHPVSARIAGVVAKVHAEDNQHVRASELLVELDPSDERVKLEQAEAQARVVEQQIVQSQAQAQQMRAQVRRARAEVEQARALERRAGDEAARYEGLNGAEMKAVSKSEIDAVRTGLLSARADLAAREEGVSAAVAQAESIDSAVGVLRAQLGVLQAQIRQARQQLSYSAISAPANGRIGKRSVEIGMRVQPGQELLAVVQDETWIVANFKETQVADLRPGMRAQVRLDGLPDELLTGRVDSLAPASGAQFALLPPDNATGNFTKIVQRIPVKVVLDRQAVQALGGRLVPGMSAVVAVERSASAGAEPAPQYGAAK